MSASASASDQRTTTTNTQQSAQGASGANSPTTTITSAGPVTNVDTSVQLATIDVARQAIAAALGGAGQLITQQGQNAQAIQQAEAQQASAQSDLLSAVLQQQAQASAAVQTGGATLTYGTNNYLIWGAVAVVVAFLFFGRRRTA